MISGINCTPRLHFVLNLGQIVDSSLVHDAMPHSIFPFPQPLAVFCALPDPHPARTQLHLPFHRRSIVDPRVLLDVQPTPRQLHRLSCEGVLQQDPSTQSPGRAHNFPSSASARKEPSKEPQKRKYEDEGEEDLGKSRGEYACDTIGRVDVDARKGLWPGDADVVYISGLSNDVLKGFVERLKVPPVMQLAESQLFQESTARAEILGPLFEAARGRPRSVLQSDGGFELGDIVIRRLLISAPGRTTSYQTSSQRGPPDDRNKDALCSRSVCHACCLLRSPLAGTRRLRTSTGPFGSTLSLIVPRHTASESATLQNMTSGRM